MDLILYLLRRHTRTLAGVSSFLRRCWGFVENRDKVYLFFPKLSFLFISFHQSWNFLIQPSFVKFLQRECLFSGLKMEDMKIHLVTLLECCDTIQFGRDRWFVYFLIQYNSRFTVLKWFVFSMCFGVTISFQNHCESQWICKSYTP